MYEDRLDGRITGEQYDKIIGEYDNQKYELNFKIKQLSNANNAYYITAGKVLSLAQRANEIFKSSEIDEKRQLLKMLFQNLKLDGKKLEYKLKTPFQEVLLANTTHNWGLLWDTFRTFRYKEILEDLTALKFCDIKIY